MLKGINPILSPDLLKTLMEMGHGDEITIADGNFPSHSCCKNVIRMDGHGIEKLLEAILVLFPLDDSSEKPVTLMKVADGDTTKTPIWDEYKKIIKLNEKRGENAIEEIERMDFYKRVIEKSYAVIATSEKALYANIILKKVLL